MFHSLTRLSLSALVDVNVYDFGSPRFLRLNREKKVRNTLLAHAGRAFSVLYALLEIWHLDHLLRGQRCHSVF